MRVLDFVGQTLDTQHRHRMYRVPGGAVAECVSELDEAGFYRYTPVADREKAKRAPINSLNGYGYLFDHTHRKVYTDSEDIEESGVFYFLEDVRPLAPCSEIVSTFVREEYQSSVKVVEFTGFQCRVWDWSEFTDNPDAWLLAQDRAVRMMNRLLETYEYEERLYYHHTGNDNQVIMVTPRIARILERYGAVRLNTF